MAVSGLVLPLALPLPLALLVAVTVALVLPCWTAANRFPGRRRNLSTVSPNVNHRPKKSVRNLDFPTGDD